MVEPRRSVEGAAGAGAGPDTRGRPGRVLYRGRLVVLGGQRALLELLIDAVRLRGGLDVHERHSGARAHTAPRSRPQLAPRHHLDTLHPSISANTNIMISRLKSYCGKEKKLFMGVLRQRIL